MLMNVNGKSYRFQRLWGSVSSDGSVCVVRFTEQFLEVEKRKEFKVIYNQITGIRECSKWGIGELVSLVFFIILTVSCFVCESLWGIAGIIFVLITAFHLKTQVITIDTVNGSIDIPMAKKESSRIDFLNCINAATDGRLQNQIDAIINQANVSNI